MVAESGCGKASPGSQREHGPQDSPQAGQHLWDGSRAMRREPDWRTEEEITPGRVTTLSLHSSKTHDRKPAVICSRSLQRSSENSDDILHLEAAWVI